MDLEKVKELIKKGEAFSENESCRTVAKNFGEFIALYEQKDALKEDLEYLRKLDASYKQLWSSIRKASGGMGISIPGLKDYFENPAHFSKEEWQNLQILKRQLAPNRPVVSSPKGSKRFVRNTSKMRI